MLGFQKTMLSPESQSVCQSVFVSLSPPPLPMDQDTQLLFPSACLYAIMVSATIMHQTSETVSKPQRNALSYNSCFSYDASYSNTIVTKLAPSLKSSCSQTQEYMQLHQCLFLEVQTSKIYQITLQLQEKTSKWFSFW